MQDGSYSFAYESTIIVIRVVPYYEGVVVVVSAQTNFEVPGSPEFFEYVATPPRMFSSAR